MAQNLIKNQFQVIAKEALAGATDVKKKFEAFLALSTDFDKTVYALKIGVRDEAEYMAEVEQIAQHEDADFELAELPYALEIKIIVNNATQLFDRVVNFVDLIGIMRTPRVDLLAGTEIRDAYRRVHITISENAPPAYGVVHSRLKELLDKQGVDFVELRQRNFCSVDLIVNAVTQSVTGRVHVPVRVKIRTVIEDLWIETNARHVRQIRDHRSSSIDREDNLSRGILELRSMVDAFGLSFDAVWSDIHAFETGVFSPSKIDEDRVPTQIPRHCRTKLISKDAPEVVQAGQLNILALFDKIYEEAGRASEPTITIAMYQRLEEAVVQAEQLEEQYRSLDLPLFTKDIDFRIFIKMEKGLAYYWMARAERDTSSSEIDRSLLSRSKALFYEILDLDKNDSVALFRLSLVYFLDDEPRVCFERLNSAYEKISTEEGSQFAGPIYTSLITRQFCYVLWADASRQLKTDPHDGSVKAKSLLSRAIVITKEFLESGVDRLEQASQVRESDRYRNNLLSYIVSYREGGGRQEDLNVDGINEEYIRKQLELLDLSINSPQRLDTAARVTQLLGDTARSAEYALKLDDLLKQPEVRSTLTTEELEYAEKTLKICLPTQRPASWRSDLTK